MEDFKCLNCGSSELMYQKWVKCEDKVIVHPNDIIEYYDQQIDDTDVLGAECRFVCGTCKKPLLLHNADVITEDELVAYLEMTFDERVKMQADYDVMEEEEALDQEIQEEAQDCEPEIEEPVIQSND